MYDLMVIGGGPAGLTATVYAARKRLNGLLISSDIGGQVNWTFSIENYLGYQLIEGPELITKFHAQVDQYPIDQRIGEKVSRLEKLDEGFTAATGNGASYRSRTVVYATGKRPRQLNVPGETEYIGRGVSYCAVCDGPIFSGQQVAVIGGGNSALGTALDMSKIAEHVDLVSSIPLTGDAMLVKKLAHVDNVETFIGHEVERIEGQRFVSAILIKESKSGTQIRLDVSGVFVEIGLDPNSEPVKGLVKLNRFGEVIVSCACETGVPGLYAAGDVTNVADKQIVIAAGEGAKAALQAHRYLQKLKV